jgi:FkbM family methyltransferase
VTWLSDFLTRLRLHLRMPDFRANPIRAIVRRLRWRLHFALHRDTPYVVEDWWRGLAIALPRGGSGPSIFYGQLSDNGIFRFMCQVIKEGDTVFDVGSHIGSYSLICSRLAGPTGRVFAFEPNPSTIEMLKDNILRNRPSNIHAIPLAISDREEESSFSFDQFSGHLISQKDAPRIASEDVARISTTTLARFAAQQGLERIDFIKLDAGGNELAAIRGGEALLSGANAPYLLVKLYPPAMALSRFDYDVSVTGRTLLSWGYSLEVLVNWNRDRITYDEADLPRLFHEEVYTVPLICTPRRLTGT